ncbi:MAG: hypothetical protein QM779_06500 [Propionicimonas sp.]|uniref:hypothetical protein n=1 Tax=Propionicimonas sp. TaxID=1955623 RepID=UPI003D0BA2FD
MTARSPRPRSREDPIALWRRERHRAPAPGESHEPWCRGHGWMLDAGVVDALAPALLTDNFGDDTYFRLTVVGADIAARLLAILPEDYLSRERQNDGPTIGTVLRAVVARPEEVLAHGYVIGPSRCDERVTLEGVLFRVDEWYRLCPLHGPALDRCECERLYARLREEFGVDDATVFPHELDAWMTVDAAHGGTGAWYRAWWD